MICPSVSFRLQDPDSLAVGFEQVVISVVLFTVLFADQNNDLFNLSSTCAIRVVLIAESQRIDW